MPCMYDSWDLNYKFPFGAIRRRSDCNFTIYLPTGVTPDFPPVMVLFRTGFKERFLPMNANGEQDGCKCYTVTYSPKYAGVHYYYFAYTSNGVRHYIKRGTAHEAALDHGELYQLTVFAKHYETPNFLKGGIMYQIFPDRFCKSGKPHENVPTDRVLRDDWNGTPYYKPDANGHVWNNDYFGGDLEGIRSKLDYLEKLGVTCIYLNPIFESHENHRYNTANYRNVDPLLGTNEDFRVLCEDAEKHGISIILDGVFSHTGADSIYFNKFGRYDTVGAWQSTDSPYYSWYTFFGDHQYEAWWGIDTLPNVVETNPDYLNYICGDGGVLDYWISLGAAGYRLDVADELPDGFLDALRKCVKKNGEEKIVIGEVWEDASNKESYGVKRRYLLGDQLDSVMNYPFREAIINYIKGMDANTFKDWIMGILENYPKQTVDVLMNFVSTHDIERAINRFGGQNCDDKSKDWMAENWLSDAEYKRGKQLLKAAMVLQFFLPGVPQVYYVGALAGKNDMELLRKTNNGRDINRHYYSTAEIDENLQRPVVKALNALAKFRNELDAFDGTFSYSADGDTSISFTWEGTTTQATLTFEPGRGLGVENTASVATLEWRDAAGEHRTDDLIANPPVAA